MNAEVLKALERIESKLDALLAEKERPAAYDVQVPVYLDSKQIALSTYREIARLTNEDLRKQGARI